MQNFFGGFAKLSTRQAEAYKKKLIRKKENSLTCRKHFHLREPEGYKGYM